MQTVDEHSLNCSDAVLYVFVRKHFGTYQNENIQGSVFQLLVQSNQRTLQRGGQHAKQRLL